MQYLQEFIEYAKTQGLHTSMFREGDFVLTSTSLRYAVFTRGKRIDQLIANGLIKTKTHKPETYKTIWVKSHMGWATAIVNHNNICKCDHIGMGDIVFELKEWITLEDYNTAERMMSTINNMVKEEVSRALNK